MDLRDETTWTTRFRSPKSEKIRTTESERRLFISDDNCQLIGSIGR